MQLKEKTAMLLALILLSACKPALQDSCRNGTLCAYATQEKDAVHFMVANRTNRHVVMPRIFGLETPHTRFRLEPIGPVPETQCEKSLDLTMARAPEPFPLDSYQIAGMAIPTEPVREIYCLPKGCRDFRVSFDVLNAAQGVTSESLHFDPHVVNLCL